MKKITIKNIIEFNNKSDRSKKTFVQNLKSERKSKESEGGGDYWISSLSAISNSYKTGNLEIIRNKIHELEDKFEMTDFERTKTMYKRNINILYKYEVYDFDRWKPKNELKYLKKIKSDYIIPIQGLNIEAVPNHVFTFQNNENKEKIEIGAIWFIAKLDGFIETELAIFTDILFRYLVKNFSKDYIVNPNYIISVDVANNIAVNYKQLLDGKIQSILDKSIEEIKKTI